MATSGSIMLTRKELADLVKRLGRADIAAPQIIVARSADSSDPDGLADVVERLGALVEAEKVLRDWLTQYGGVIYQDNGAGYVLQSTRRETAGAAIRRDENPFPTLAQCLEYCLEYARETIATQAVQAYMIDKS